MHPPLVALLVSVADGRLLWTVALPALRGRRRLPANLGCRPLPSPLSVASALVGHSAGQSGGCCLPAPAGCRSLLAGPPYVGCLPALREVPASFSSDDLPGREDAGPVAGMHCRPLAGILMD